MFLFVIILLLVDEKPLINVLCHLEKLYLKKSGKGVTKFGRNVTDTFEENIEYVGAIEKIR